MSGWTKVEDIFRPRCMKVASGFHSRHFIQQYDSSVIRCTFVEYAWQRYSAGEHFRQSGTANKCTSKLSTPILTNQYTIYDNTKPGSIIHKHVTDALYSTKLII